MRNCIFTAHCTEPICDKSCPKFAETSYLLERNGINLNSFVFTDSSVPFAKAVSILHASDGAVGAVLVDNGKYSTVQWAEILTYCAICENWQGNRLHCNVYNLKFSTYVEEIRKSWNTRSESEQLEMMRIWAQSAKILIISNFDYVGFNDFESQTMLNLIQSRETGDKTTILVSMPPNRLVSNKWNQFMDVMRQRISDAASVVKEGLKK